ncbi:MAG: DUF4129 domain-containing protein [Chloroflexi bacterium]|nr:DUF4129 domain-containing protein [Chloroflexota bacterium]
MIGLVKQLENALSRRGFRRRLPSETPDEYGREAAELVPAQEQAIKRLTEIASRAAFDPQPFDDRLVDAAGRELDGIIGWLPRDRRYRRRS